jgi:hypothetical protein
MIETAESIHWGLILFRYPMAGGGKQLAVQALTAAAHQHQRPAFADRLTRDLEFAKLLSRYVHYISSVYSNQVTYKIFAHR